MFKILHAEQLPILQIVQLIFIWGLKWQDIWVEHSWLCKFSIFNHKNRLIIKHVKSFRRFCNSAKCTVRVHVGILIPQCTAVSGKAFHWDRNHALGILRILVVNILFKSYAMSDLRELLTIKHVEIKFNAKDFSI